MWWIHMSSFSGLSSTAAKKLLAGKMITLIHSGQQQAKFSNKLYRDADNAIISHS
jgi:hypothetical protein